MGIAESEHYLFQEFQFCCSITFTNRLCFHPFGEFINCHEEVSVPVGGSFKRSHHIKLPHCKGLGDRDHSEFLSRHVILLFIALTSITLLDYILCIRMCCEPIETVSVGFSYERTRAGMISTISRVYFFEDGSSFF